VEVMFCEETRDVFCMTVTPACSEGALGTWRFQGWHLGHRAEREPTLEAGTSLRANQRQRGVCVPALELRHEMGRRAKDSQGQNRTGENPLSGIAGRPAETWPGEPD